MRKVLTVVGARPQFVKAAAVSRAMGSVNELTEVIVHTGQHFDDDMSEVFFGELSIPRPAYNLGVSGGNHGAMTGRMLAKIEDVVLAEKPDWLLVYGDTNSTLAGALAASKLDLPIAHVEAGLRSFNTKMPEEINRIIVDRISTLLFCPTIAAQNNLAAEGCSATVRLVGDVMFDVALYYKKMTTGKSGLLSRVTEGNFVLATCHRAENTNYPERLGNILEALSQIADRLPVILPLHPRTRSLIEKYDLTRYLDKLIATNPLSYLEMIALEQSAAVICTDSGGVQKEAFFYGVPCVTLRDETEWVELVDGGWNVLAGADVARIVEAVSAAEPLEEDRPAIYGDGHSADKIVSDLASY